MYWYKKLLEDPIDKNFNDNLYEILKKEYKVFYEQYDSNVCEREKDRLNEWYYSEEGQLILLQLIKDIWNILKITSNNAMPGHDARHAIYKVPTFSMKYIEAENIRDYRKLAIIGALGHDFGRWSEERFFGNAVPGAMHSRMSFVLMREILEKYNIPQELKNEVLKSIICHTTGATEEDNMITKIVVSSDREQLISPEIVIRLIHHKPTEKKMQSLFGENGDESVIEIIMKYYFTRLPGPLYSLPDTQEFYSVLHTFCRLALGKEKWEEYLSNKVSIVNFEKDREYANEIINNFNYRDINIHEVMLETLSAPNLAPNPIYKDIALMKIDYTQDEQLKYNLANALEWINQKRIEFDLREFEDLGRIEQYEDDWIVWLIKEIKKGWF